jgi:hypothetical protein
MDCASCHTPLPESARFCLSCGAPVVLQAVFFLPFAALALLAVESVLYGRRLVRTLGPGLADPRQAAQALHTPSWKRAFWDRPPFDALLLPKGRPPAPTPSEAATLTRPPEPPAGVS